MHAWILGVAAAATALLASAARAADDDDAARPCPRSTAAVLERFISAECESCWTDPSVARPDAGEWLLDWIVPSARGESAPLSGAAPVEARGRVERAMKATPTEDQPGVQRTPARGASSLQLRVLSGPAWNGYFGVQIDGSGRAPAGSAAWVALVESVASGTDGTVAPREVVRTVSGPLVPAELRQGKPWQHLLAMRWPETAKASRLRARAWIEDAGGHIVAMAGERCDAR